ncbi:MAG: hypothetical protein PSV46_07805 [Reyranella sp.]|nr:hypothetical protein [Reyranella sp.]
MSPELFVGPLSIYHEGSWRVPAPPFVRPEPRPHDTEMVRMYQYKFASEEDPLPEPSAAQTELQTRIEAWRDRLNQTFASVLASPLAWDEAEKVSGAAQPDLHALKLWAASWDQPKIRKATDWRSIDARSVASRSTMVRFSQILEAPDLWLPAAFDFSINADDPMGEPAVLGSINSLWHQLDDLNFCKHLTEKSRLGI